MPTLLQPQPGNGSSPLKSRRFAFTPRRQDLPNIQSGRCRSHEYGLEARWFTMNAALDRTVRVVEGDGDGYGRFVADILSRGLVKAGYARWFPATRRATAGSRWGASVGAVCGC